MIKDIGILSGVTASLFILLYALLYAFRNLHSFSDNTKIRKFINKILPFLTKFNSFFLLTGFFFALLHVYSFYPINSIINSGYVILFMILFIFKITYIPSKKKNYAYNFKFFSYLLVLSILVHVVIE